VVAVGVVGMTIVGIVATVRTGEPLWLFISLPFSLVLWIVGRFAPSGYRLAGDGVHIERRAGDRVVPYGRIRTVDREERPLRGVSILGTKGAFGRVGKFWNGTLGVYELHVANGEAVVWLDTADGWIGVSPDRPDEFVDRLRARLSAVR
jgi:hypothetical protein